MKYRVQHKQLIITNNQIFTPDNFSSWKIINYGTNPIIINDTIVINQGESYGIELQPYVLFDTVINVKFDTTGGGTSRAAIIRLYYSEQ